MRTWSDRLFDGAGYLAGVFMVGTLVTVLLSIAGRLTPALNLPGADAYAGYCTAASAFLALAPTLRRGEHIRVTLLFNQLQPAVRHWADLACHVLGLLLAGALAWFSMRLAWQSHAFNDISTGLDATPLWIPQLAMGAGTTLLTLAFALDGWQLLRGRPLNHPSADGELVRSE
jgi:TRAP-type C4-dicarboxylate transport system permease small subunit